MALAPLPVRAALSRTQADGKDRTLNLALLPKPSKDMC